MKPLQHLFRAVSITGLYSLLLFVERASADEDHYRIISLSINTGVVKSGPPGPGRDRQLTYTPKGGVPELLEAKDPGGYMEAGFATGNQISLLRAQSNTGGEIWLYLKTSEGWQLEAKGHLDLGFDALSVKFASLKRLEVVRDDNRPTDHFELTDRPRFRSSLYRMMQKNGEWYTPQGRWINGEGIDLEKFYPKKPSWLTLGPVIKAESAGKDASGATAFRPRSGGLVNSRHRVRMSDRRVLFETDLTLDWAGNDEEGRGCSLSPNGKKLILSGGGRPSLYGISTKGEVVKVPQRFPDMTYQEDRRGFLGGWSWADDETVLGTVEIYEANSAVVETRLYVYHVEKQILRRVDLKELKLPSNKQVEVIAIGKDMQHLKLRIDGQEILVKADMRFVE